MGDQETTIDIGLESRRSEDDMDNDGGAPVHSTLSQRPQRTSTQGEIFLNLRFYRAACNADAV